MQVLQQWRRQKRVLKSALDAVVTGLDTRFEQPTYLHETFDFLLDAERLMTADASDCGCAVFADEICRFCGSISR